MPNIKAAEKWVRQSEKRTALNKDKKTRLKTIFKKAVTTQDAEFAKSVESEYDKAAKSGVIHKNKAARKKSRLAKSLAKAATAPAPKAKSTKAPAKPAAKSAKKTSAKK
ncbi:MAG TPA: 30S ribosomal protein S20 [Candidatus Acidoferrales bacterium]|nr:30S ribosomal protein S20 [Candidatus Acidoferrales bacterium]